jgi:deoxyadenosine/deoxycytidine kinase
MIYISLEGNIGAGKSTLIKALGDTAVIVDEPVKEWMELKDSNGTSILELFYDDPKRYAYTFQHASMMTRTQKVLDAMERGYPEVLLSERSLVTDHEIFVKTLHKDGTITDLEYKLYCMTLQMFIENRGVYPTAFIYMDTPPEICLERIRKRAREGEEHITLEYLQKLHEAHVNWLDDPGAEFLPILRLAHDDPDMSKKIQDFVQDLKRI